MNYNLYKTLRRNKSSITLFGYSRNLGSVHRASTVNHAHSLRGAQLFKLFLNVQNEIEKFHQKIVQNTSLDSIRHTKHSSNSYNKNINSNYVDSFVMDLDSDGHCTVSVAKDHKINKVTNHVGNFDILLSILKSNRNDLMDNKACDSFQLIQTFDGEYYEASKTITLIENYLHLIKFCFKYLGKSVNEFTQEESEYFKVNLQSD